MCGGARPKVKSPKARRPSLLEEDCIHTSGCRHAVWLFVHSEVRDSPWILRHAQKYELMTIFFVIYLVVSDIIVSIPEIGAVTKESQVYFMFEAFIYGVFTVEYLMRMWSCMESRELAALGPLQARLKLMKGVMEVVDLVVLIAYYINFIPGFSQLKGLQALRMIRLLRVAALLKMERKASSFGQIVNVLKTKKSELMATLFTAVVLMIMSATTMYYLENDTQPEGFASVPGAMWWSVASLTTVGYGDVVPMTPAGKVLGAVVAFFGVGLFALPAGILGSGFVEEVERAKKLAEKENADSDEDQEMLNEQEDEMNKITLLTDNIKAMRSSAEEMQRGQREVVNLLNGVCPTLEIPNPVPSQGQAAKDPDALVTDQDLVDLQDSVTLKLERLKRSGSLR